ncbi:MAG: hypothetical protein ACF8XB_20620, partial [Planctomycetota bacterium JB042]
TLSEEFFDAVEAALDAGAIGSEDLDSPDFDRWRGDPRLRALRERLERDGAGEDEREAEEPE